MNFKGILLASDCDGTVLDHSGNILEKDQVSIRRFCDGGGLFALCTGRTRLGVRAALGLIPSNAPAILGNGSIIYDYAKDETLFRRTLDGDYQAILTRIAHAHTNLGLEIHSEDALWVYNPNEYNEAHFNAIKVRGETITDLDIPPKPWLKAVLVGSAEDIAAVRGETIAALGDGFSAVYSVPIFLEILHRDANKGAGVERLRQMLGISYDNTYVIGDGNNDVPMLSRFKSFVPADGSEDALRYGTTVAPLKQGAVSHAIDIIGSLL